MIKNKLIFILLIIVIVLLIFFLRFDKKEISYYEKTKTYLNHNDTVNYVGKETCKECHYEIYESYIKTGMGSSFQHATKTKSIIDDNNNPIIYDSIKEIYYQPLWKEDSLYILEFKLFKKDTIHQRLEKVKYIIGSGHHTNSHLYEINGYLHQLPYTFYSQKGIADLPPGYENGNNTRFSREIGMECITCHNAYPNYEYNSSNRYSNILTGIDCERCHGPGEIHVIEKKKGIIIDVENEIDYTIVNPSKLEEELQFEICSRCHLQGITILQEGKNWTSFLPGQKLSETMDVFIPKFKDDNKFIMASHVDRLKQSECFTVGGVNCITCHNPHKSVQKTSINVFNNKCQECHEFCKDDLKHSNCISCHMKPSSSLDIPHITITDHKISIPNEESRNVESEIKEFIGLMCINNDNPSYTNKAKAYLKLYEGFQNKQIYLDSAYHFINKIEHENIFVLMNYYYLTKDYKSIIKKFEKDFYLSSYKSMRYSDLSKIYFWTAEAYGHYEFYEQSYQEYLKAVKLAPNNLHFLLKTSIIEIKLSRFELAKNRLNKILDLNPKYEKALYNLGLIYLNVEKDYLKSKDLFKKAIKLNPEYELAINKLNEISENF